MKKDYLLKADGWTLNAMADVVSENGDPDGISLLARQVCATLFRKNIDLYKPGNVEDLLDNPGFYAEECLLKNIEHTLRKELKKEEE